MQRKTHTAPTCPNHGTCPRRDFFKGGDITGAPDVMAAWGENGERPQGGRMEFSHTKPLRRGHS